MKGVPGDVGVPGMKGVPGDMGLPGEKGMLGMKGEQGMKGEDACLYTVECVDDTITVYLWPDFVSSSLVRPTCMSSYFEDHVLLERQ